MVLEAITLETLEAAAGGLLFFTGTVEELEVTFFFCWPLGGDLQALVAFLAFEGEEFFGVGESHFLGLPEDLLDAIGAGFPLLLGTSGGLSGGNDLGGGGGGGEHEGGGELVGGGGGEESN